MLRASSDATGRDYSLDAISQGSEAGDGNVPHGALLVEFAEAAHRRDELAMAPLRQRIVEALSEESLVDTCGVVANFQRMVRIADGTGIPLDDMMLSVSSDIRPELGVDQFHGALNSETSASQRLLQRLGQPVLRRALLRMAERPPES